jgi:hypothetical protein
VQCTGLKMTKILIETCGHANLIDRSQQTVMMMVTVYSSTIPFSLLIILHKFCHLTITLHSYYSFIIVMALTSNFCNCVQYKILPNNLAEKVPAHNSTSSHTTYHQPQFHKHAFTHKPQQDLVSQCKVDLHCLHLR